MRTRLNVAFIRTLLLLLGFILDSGNGISL
jgi:hypothetical protein